MACDCGKCLEIRGLASGQSYFVELLEYIFKLLVNNAGNLPAMF